MTSHVLAALRGRGWNVVHIDTSDHRPVGNVGHLDIENVFLAAKHALMLMRATRQSRQHLLYLPIAQGNLGFLRDALFFEIAKARKIPVVIHLHGAAFSEFYRSTNRPMQWLIRRCIRGSHYALVLSESLRSVFEGLVPDSRIGVVRNGIPAPIDSHAPSRRSQSCLTVLFLSNLSTGKGYGDLLEAARIISQKRSDIRFLVAGEWPTKRDRLRSTEWVKQYGIEQVVQFVVAPSGLRKHQLFREADIFVFPPRQVEGQPIVILEAMSHALPVVATPQGGIVDIVRADTSGIFVPPGDPAAIAGAILRLANDEKLRSRLGHEGRRIYEDSHTTERMTQSLDELFACLVEGAA